MDICNKYVAFDHEKCSICTLLTKLILLRLEISTYCLHSLWAMEVEVWHSVTAALHAIPGM